MTDPRCTDPDVDRRATFYDASRAVRLILASLRDDDEQMAIVKHELGECTDCLRGVIDVLVGSFNGLALSVADDDVALVEEQVEQQLAAIVDGTLEI